jgi:hypothetical protein
VRTTQIIPVIVNSDGPVSSTVEAGSTEINACNIHYFTNQTREQIVQNKNEVFLTALSYVSTTCDYYVISSLAQHVTSMLQTGMAFIVSWCIMHGRPVQHI